MIAAVGYAGLMLFGLAIWCFIIAKLWNVRS